MATIEIYTKGWCGYCKAAKSLLDSVSASYTEHDVTHDVELENQMRERAYRTSVPQIFIDGEHIGGFDDLNRFGRERLQNRLKAA